MNTIYEDKTHRFYWLYVLQMFHTYIRGFL